MRSRMSASFALILSLAVSARLAASDPNDAAKKAAARAAETWLALVDDGKYDESWASASTFFRKSITQEKWRAAVEAARGPLGKVKKRTAAGATYATSLPGAPDGSYVVLTHQTSFANAASTIETTTPMLDSDGSWRVSGYFVKPASP